MKKLIVLIGTSLLLMGMSLPSCAPSKVKSEREACFDSGGSEYHVGWLAGQGSHYMCVFKP